MRIGASIFFDGNPVRRKKMDVLKRQISTTMIAGIVFSIAVTLFCILFARPLLLLIRVQEEVLPLAVSYLRIGVFGIYFYHLTDNFFACTLRALGRQHDTRSDFSVPSSGVHYHLGICFVAVLRWGSMGCGGLHRLSSEAVCCMLCIIYIKRKVPELNLLGEKHGLYSMDLAAETGTTSLMDGASCDAAGEP